MGVPPSILAFLIDLKTRVIGRCYFFFGQDENGDPIFPFAPGPDCGAFVIEEKDGGGGWIATASDYAKFISFIDGSIPNAIFEQHFDFLSSHFHDFAIVGKRWK